MGYAYLDSNVFVNALSALFEFIFTDILGPILKDVFTVFVNFFTNVIWNLLSEFLIGLFLMLCSLVDFIESLFNVFAGIAPVKVGTKYITLLDALFEMEEVTWVLCCITLASFGICIFFTIYKTAKSISDMALENKNPISKVLSDALKASITFLLIPFLCVSMLQLASKVTDQVCIAFEEAQGERGTVGTILFLSATMDADTDTTQARDLITGTIQKDSGRNPSFQDSLRFEYLNGTKNYRVREQVVKDFHPANVSYISGFVSVIMMLLILFAAIFTFIRRMFELLILYIVSPLFVSTIPLDDGITFARWREMFIAKFFSGFGMIFSMKYYLLVVPMISSSRLQLYDTSLPGGTMINSVLQIFLIIGGAWAVFKSQSLILQILSPDAAQAEQQASSFITGMLVGRAGR